MPKIIPHIKTCLWLLIFSFASLPVFADHMVGSDITYKCLDANGNYKITLVYYRDCQGIPTCSGSCSTIGSCSKTVAVRGADPSCNGTLFLNFTVTGVSVRDVNPNPRCPNAKMICTNMGCITPGTLTPAVERYEFQGIVNLGPSSGIPATCCNVTISFQECCRSLFNQNITSGNFYTDATINRCAATYPDCNSPDLTNDPYAVLCAGQGFVFNNGAFDPDLDSLVYSFTPSLYGYGVSATYIAPYSYDIPMPYKPPLSGNYPFGIKVDPLSGDIMFTPNAFPFTGVLALRMEQWRMINGVYVVVGVTRRDLQMYIKYCDPNTPPTFRTDPPGMPPLKPKTKYEVCAGDQICFDIIAKDTDFNPPTVSDTTFLSWNKVMENFGATFTPNYAPAARQLQGPREDTYKVCWTPQDIHCKRGQPTTYPFTIKAVDSRCPYPGIILQGFSIRVLPRADVEIKKDDNGCGRWVVRYQKNPALVPAQTFQSTTIMIAKNPEDYSFMGGAYTYANVQSSPVLYFPKGGKYLIEVTINMLGPSTGGFCSRTYRDTLYVITPVTSIIRDTFTCKNVSMTISASGQFGSAPYTYRWYNNIKDTLTPLNGPVYTSANYNVSPTSTRHYTLQIRDINGCRSWDSIAVQVKQLPVGLLADSARICFGDTFLLDPGNNNGNIRSYLWNTGDTTAIIARKDSNTFTVIMTDTFGCVNPDSLKLFVNAKINARAGLDTFICQKDTTLLMGEGGSQYMWKNLANGQTISAKSYIPFVKVNPTNTAAATKYQVTVYQSYPDTTNKNLECSAVDTVAISVRPLPTLSKPSTPTIACYGSLVANLYPFNTPVPGQQGGTGVWSYPKAPGAVVFPNTGPSITSQPAVKLDSLKNKPSGDSFNTHDNYVNFTYTEPVYGCKNTDSAIVRIYGRPPVDAGTRLTVCENITGTIDLQTTAYQGLPPNGHNVQPKYNSGLSAQYNWIGNGIDSVMSPVKKFYFNPSKAGVLKLPAVNVITYKYYQSYGPWTYNFVPYTTQCVNSDTTIFAVTAIPQINAGSEISVCKNEPVFNIATKTGATISPITGESYWIAKNANTTGKGIVNAGVDFDASQPGVPYSASKEMIIFKDSSTGCLVSDTTYLTIVGYPKVDVSFSLNDKNDSAHTMCLSTGNYDVYTWINDTLKAGYTNSAAPEYSYLGTPAWHPITSGTINDGLPKAYFNSNESVLTAGTHDLIFKYSQSNGVITCSNTDVAKMTVEQPPVVTVTPGGAICAYDNEIPVSVDVQPTTYTINWSTAAGAGSFANNAATSTTFTPSQTSKDAGTVWVYATTLQTGTCVPQTDSTTVRIDKVPVAGYNCPDCDGCEPLTSNLNALPTGVSNAKFNWVWIDGYGNNNSDSAFTRTIPFYGTDGEHPFSLIVESGESTACRDTIEGKMVVRAKPQAGFTFDPPYTTIAKPFFTFTNTSTVKDNTILSYIWDMGDLPGVDPASRIMTDPNPAGVPFKEDTTLIKLRVTSEYQCWDTTSHIMKVEPDITVFTPNAFYPNSSVPCPDGNEDCNRSFQIAATGYASVEIFVFNRWGQQVYYSNVAEEGWNGRINNKGDECPQDVYIYQVNATSFNGKLYKYSGSITLLR